MNDGSQTWHYGLVARHWAENNTAGPEIPLFQSLIEQHGHPALDAGCGTGRLLIPFLRAGLDVDGCDVSPDMLALCREKAECEGLRPTLYQQPLHSLDLPRTYQTIVVCGALGLGVSRQQDFEALQRIHSHLKPGGVLLIDHYLPYGDAREWQLWPRAMRGQLPEPWPDGAGTRPPANGADYALYSRIVAFDPLEQRLTREMRGVLWRDGQLVAQEEYTLWENLYFYQEFCQMLERAGFVIEAVYGGHTKVSASADDDVMVFVARKPATE